ncbi:MAG TPA: Trm112 family protein [Xanthomonadales bacterium]
MPVNGKLLEILCCPVSKTPLTVLGRQKLEKLNKAIENGEALYVGGEKVTQPLQEGLITEDGKVIYPVQDDIPILLEEKGIGTTQFQDF